MNLFILNYTNLKVIMISELHLLEYKQRMLEYLSCFKSVRPKLFGRNSLSTFSSPTDGDGYNDAFITGDLITDLYLEFVAKVRQSESVEYCKTRTGESDRHYLNFNVLIYFVIPQAKSISLDNTFKSAGKAVIVDKDGRRQKPMKGGVLSAINEESEGLTFVSRNR